MAYVHAKIKPNTSKIVQGERRSWQKAKTRNSLSINSHLYRLYELLIYTSAYHCAQCVVYTIQHRHKIVITQMLSTCRKVEWPIDPMSMTRFGLRQ